MGVPLIVLDKAIADEENPFAIVEGIEPVSARRAGTAKESLLPQQEGNAFS
jgi:hypothetical protein